MSDQFDLSDRIKDAREKGNFSDAAIIDQLVKLRMKQGRLKEPPDIDSVRQNGFTDAEIVDWLASGHKPKGPRGKVAAFGRGMNKMGTILAGAPVDMIDAAIDPRRNVQAVDRMLGTEMSGRARENIEQLVPEGAIPLGGVSP